MLRYTVTTTTPTNDKTKDKTNGISTETRTACRQQYANAHAKRQSQSLEECGRLSRLTESNQVKSLPKLAKNTVEIPSSNHCTPGMVRAGCMSPAFSHPAETLEDSGAPLFKFFVPSRESLSPRDRASSHPARLERGTDS